MNKEITLEQLASYETAFDGDRANRIAMDAVTKNGPLFVLSNLPISQVISHTRLHR